MTIVFHQNDFNAMTVSREAPERTIVRLVTERGLSAYEIAVRNGYPGTEAQWISDIEQVLSGTFATPVYILEPSEALNPTTKGYVDTADGLLSDAIDAVIASLLDYYTAAQVDVILADYVTAVSLATTLTGYAAASHTHLAAAITDLASFTGFDARYYTETEMDTLLGDKSAVGHTHSYAAASHSHGSADITDLSAYTGFDARYYTESEVDSALTGKAASSHSHAISDVTGLAAALVYDVILYVQGEPTDAELVLRLEASRGFTLPAGAASSHASALVASTGTVVFDVLKNGVSFATVTFTSSATGTFTQASDSTFVAGDVLTITAPATADATLADISISLVGSRT